VDTTITDASLLKSRITAMNEQGGAAAVDAIAKFAGGAGDIGKAVAASGRILHSASLAH
jgi:hypothetical protein